MLLWLMNLGFAGGSTTPTPTGTPCGPGYMPLMTSDGDLLIDSEGNYICVPFSIMHPDRMSTVPWETRSATVQAENRVGKVPFESRVAKVTVQ